MYVRVYGPTASEPNLLPTELQVLLTSCDHDITSIIAFAEWNNNYYRTGENDVIYIKIGSTNILL